ncbi:MAG: nucleoside triphosphate pyrophosphohydrolase [Deltaproteobacteria bacterium]|nr:MAG: nucleoside triphosphate pyrophosphohydrolase [Deltaproteobacteria bacterium]
MKNNPPDKRRTGLYDLRRVIETLRGEGGCPWDRKQTPGTLSVYLIEEMYELVDAIASGDPGAVREELGDVLFQIVFIAVLFEEAGNFGIQDVVAANIEKMIRRHPHVYGNEKLDTSEQVRQRWHQIKAMEKKRDDRASLLDSVPDKLPALMKAYRISERAARTGFDWDDMQGVTDKVEEEWSEFKEALGAHAETDSPDNDDRRDMAMEFGDLLFTLTNVARFAHIHPETSLNDAIWKFKKRFNYMETVLRKKGSSMDTASRREMDHLWNEAKREVTD